VFYESILNALQKHRVRYLVVGGVAVNLHGVPRLTGDLDLVVDLSPDNVESLLQAMEETGLKPAAPVDPHGLADPRRRRQWRNEKKLEALTFQGDIENSPYAEVDIVLETPFDFDEMYESRVSLEADNLTVDLVSLRHLIEIKRRLGREQDLADVDALEKVEASGEDEADG